jgi:hypothetical protein
MIATGFADWNKAYKTEIVDVANGVSCSDLSDFPVRIIGAVGANLNGTPVVCEGTFYEYSSSKCYRFTNGVWEDFASMKEIRSHAAAIMYNKKIHVFGGISSHSSFLKTSEIISLDGGVIDGPELPIGVWTHAMATLNDTVSILSGGWTNEHSYSAQTWYYNHDTEAFTIGPDLLEGRIWHGSATNVDKVTNAKTLIVTGGHGNGDYELDSTELLINGQWQTGTLFYSMHVLILIAIFLS